MREHIIEDFPNPEKLKEEYSFGGGYAIRWLLYEYVADGVDFHQASLQRLQLQGDESVLDIGCGQGAFLKSIESDGHEGRLVGLDTNDTLSYAMNDTAVQFVQADASCFTNDEVGTGLPLQSDSFDIAIAMFMLYHVSSPESTLRELSRVVRSAGKIAVATSGPDNKKQHRRLEAAIGRELGISKPARYTHSFTTDTADRLLPQIFPNVEIALDQQTTINITESDLQNDPLSSSGVLSAYISSIKSMSRQYGRTDNERAQAAERMNDAINKVVLPEICHQIKTTGSFVETVHRSLYICTNDK